MKRQNVTWTEKQYREWCLRHDLADRTLAAQAASQAASAPITLAAGKTVTAPILASRRPLNNETHDHSKVSNPKPQRNHAPALGKATKRKAQRVERIVVSFTGHRVRPLDPDNFAASCKNLLDGLRHAALIPEDSPFHIRLETEQVKVSHYSQEKTVIEIA